MKSSIALCALAMLCIGAADAGAQEEGYTPSLVVWNNKVHMSVAGPAAIGSDKTFALITFEGNGNVNEQPAPWPITGGIGMAPVLGVENSVLYAFVTLANNRVQMSKLDGNAWSAWQQLAPSFIGAPATATFNGKLYVFGRGTDNRYYFAYKNGAAFSQWTPILDGTLKSAPGVAAGPNGILVAGRGMDDAVWQNFFDGTNWSGWNKVGGGTYYPPAVAWLSGNDYAVFIRGTDNHLYGTDRKNGWMNMSGGLEGAPAAANLNGAVKVITRGSNGQVWERNSSGNMSFADWQVTPITSGTYISDVTVVYGAGPGIVCPAAYHKNTQDLNQDAGGAYVYLCAKRTSSKSDGLTSLDLVNWGNLGPNDSYDTHSAGTLTRSRVCGVTLIDINLNVGAGGENLYFCKTKDVNPTYWLKDVKFNSSSVVLVPWVRCSSGWNEIMVREGSNDTSTDLNANAGGKYVYACVQYDKGP